MTIQISCNNCGKGYTVPDHVAGKKVRCKACATVMHVPGAEQIEEIDAWEVEDEFGEQAALPPRRRASGPAYEDAAPKGKGKGKGISSTHVVLMVVGAGFLVLLLLCGGVAFKVVTAVKEIAEDVQEGIEEAVAEAKAARERRAEELADAKVVPLDLAEVGLPLVIDMPEGTTIEAMDNGDAINPEGTKSLSVYFGYGSLIDWQMSQNSEYETVEDLKKYVTRTYDILPKDIEVVDDRVVIYKYEGLEQFNGNAVYDFMALVTVGDDRLQIEETAGELYTREEVDFFARCIQTLRANDQPAVAAPADEGEQ